MKYKDIDFLRRFEYVANVRYFRYLSIETLQEIVFLMRSTTFNAGSTIMKRGDLNDKIHILTEGIVKVEVPYGDTVLHFDYLPPGSCFNVYSAFGEEVQSVVSFKAETKCIIETIDIHPDLEILARKHQKLAYILKYFHLLQEGNELTDFDFFRYSRQEITD